MSAVKGCADVASKMRSVTAWREIRNGRAEKRFRDRLGMWDGVTKSKASEIEDLRGLIICLTRGCRGLLRANMAGLECM